MKKLYLIAIMLVTSVIGYGQQASRSTATNLFGNKSSVAVDPPVHDVRTDGTLRIRLNGTVKDWLLGANVVPAGATAKVQIFGMDRDYKDATWKDRGEGFVKAVNYPAVSVSSDTAEVNDVGSHDTTTLYVEAPAWTTIIVMGPKDEVLYQTPLRRTVLVSRGVEINGPRIGGFSIVLPASERTHEARLQLQPNRTRSILQAASY